MIWLKPVVILVALYLVWNTFWAVAPLLVGVLLGVGLQERFPGMATVIDDIAEAVRRPPAQDITPVPRRQKTARRK